MIALPSPCVCTRLVIAKNTHKKRGISDPPSPHFVSITGQALIDTGLHALGYKYVNMDCGWMGGRHPNGTLYESPTKFPAGMKVRSGLKVQTLEFHVCTSKVLLQQMPNLATDV